MVVVLLFLVDVVVGDLIYLPLKFGQNLVSNRWDFILVVVVFVVVVVFNVEAVVVDPRNLTLRIWGGVPVWEGGLWKVIFISTVWIDLSLC